MLLVFRLCHIEHGKLPAGFHLQKGRVVSGGKMVEDETCAAAIYAEHGTSGFRMICASFFDAVARLPGYSGQG